MEQLWQDGHDRNNLALDIWNRTAETGQVGQVSLEMEREDRTEEKCQQR
jgi:hypothetical protein